MSSPNAERNPEAAAEGSGAPDGPGDGPPETSNGLLFELYARYAGEPESRSDVYGYWAFVVGSLVAFVGIVIYLLGPTSPTSPDYVVREVAFTLASFGPPVALFGILLLLPVRRRSVYVAALGTLVALGAVAGFVVAYPGNWTVGDDYSALLIGLYMVGMAAIVAVAALVPIATGEKSFFFESEYEREAEYPAVAVGESLRDGLFSIYRDGDAWQWRLIEQDALAGSPDGHLSRLESEEAVETVKETVNEAGLMEIRNAAFRLYRAAEGRWRWLLMRADGSVVADSGEHFDDRETAGASVNDLKEYGPDAELLSIEEAAIDCHRADDGWRWQLVDDNRVPLAEGSAGHGSRAAAVGAAESVRERVPDAGVLAVESYGVELFEAGDGWRWRLVTGDETEIAEGTVAYGDRRAAEEAAYDLLEALPEAPVLDRDEPAYEVADRGDGWAWRLVADERVLAESGGTPLDRMDAMNRAERMAADAADADVVRIEDAEFEYYRSADGWEWRLVTADRETVATSAGGFGDRETAADGIEEVKTQAAQAELIEYEDAAFQVYETAGEWRWRLIDEDGNVLTDSGAEHESKDEAMSSMLTVKENAPNAEVLEVETAAFELFEREGAWNWRLVDEGGETTAQGGSWYDTREDAREGMDRLADQAAASPARAMERAVFQLTVDDDWRWRFVRPDGTILAESAAEYGTRDEVESAIEEEVRPAAADAPAYAIPAVAFQLVERGDRWRWRLFDADRTELGESSVGYDAREAAEAAIDDLRTDAPTAAVYERKATTFLLTGGADDWGFKLVGEDRDTLAAGTERFETRAAAEAAATDVRALFPEAEPIEYEDAAFEVYHADDAWHWRLVDEAETVVAAGVEDYDSREAAEGAVAAVRAEVDDAGVLEVDAATFELHEDAGQWRWRLVEADGSVLAKSLSAYDDRSEARAAMRSMKQFGDDAVTQVAE